MVKKSTAVARPNLGLYLDRPPLGVPIRGLTAGQNFRIKNGEITNALIGYTAWNSIVLNGPVMLIDLFSQRSGTSVLVLGSQTDLYTWNDSTEKLTFITPIYVTGTVTITGTNTTVVGSGTAWDTSNNVTVGDEIFFGANDEDDPSKTWAIIDSITDDTHLELTVAHAAVGGGTAYTIRQMYQGTKTDHWNAETFLNAASNQDYWYVTNGVDEIQRWNGSAAQVVDMGSTFDFKCKHMRRYKNMMIYSNLTLDSASEIRPTSIRNSAIGAPENTSTLEAGEFVVHDGSSHLLGLEVLGDNLMLYSDSPGPQVLAQYVAEPLRFVFRTVLDKSAPVSGRCIANFGNYHEFPSMDGALWRWNGVEKFVVGPQIWRNVMGMFDPGRAAHANAFFDDRNGEVMWIIPLTTDSDTSSGQAETLYAEHFLEQVGAKDPMPFSKRDGKFMSFGTFSRSTGETFDGLLGSEAWEDSDFAWSDTFFSKAFPILLAGDEDGVIFSLNDAGTADGSAIDSWVRFGRRVAVNGRDKALVTRIYPFAKRRSGATYTLDVNLYTTDQVSGDLTDQGILSHDLTQAGNRFVNPYKTARFFEIRFGTNGSNEGWELDGYDFDLRKAGQA